MTERRLNGVAALIAAQNTSLKVGVDEKHTEFVKRIVNAYADALEAIEGERVGDDAKGYFEAAMKVAKW